MAEQCRHRDDRTVGKSVSTKTLVLALLRDDRMTFSQFLTYFNRNRGLFEVQLKEFIGR